MSSRIISIKKVGNLYYRLSKKVNSKAEAEREKEIIQILGKKVKVEKKGRDYLIWYAPDDVEWQTLAKWEWKRRRRVKE